MTIRRSNWMDRLVKTDGPLGERWSLTKEELDMLLSNNPNNTSQERRNEMTENKEAYQLDDADKEWIAWLEELIERIKAGEMPTILILCDNWKEKGIKQLINGNATLLLGATVNAFDEIRNPSRGGGGILDLLRGLE